MSSAIKSGGWPAQRPVAGPTLIQQQNDDLRRFAKPTIRKRFRKWMGDGFDSWFEESRERVVKHCGDTRLEDFEADWHPEGVQAYYRDRVLIPQIGQIVSGYADRIRLELTEELLESAFALGNGERVTWGQATIDQHTQRIALLTGNIAGNIETAARHQTAIDMIQEVGAENLAALAGESVVA